LFTKMSLNSFNRFCPSFINRTQLRENIELSRVSGNNEKYVIPMHRQNCWTNKWMQEPRENCWTDKWMQEPRKNVYGIQEHQWNPRRSYQYRTDWGMRMFR